MLKDVSKTFFEGAARRELRGPPRRPWRLLRRGPSARAALGAAHGAHRGEELRGRRGPRRELQRRPAAGHRHLNDE